MQKSEKPQALPAAAGELRISGLGGSCWGRRRRCGRLADFGWWERLEVGPFDGHADGDFVVF
jgi:hypothetical protein